MKNGEHWFHTDEQMKFLDEWIIKSSKKIPVEQNRCAMACQGYGAVFLYTLIKKQWKPSPTSSILQTGIVTPK